MDDGRILFPVQEYETKVVDRKPGQLTDELRIALGMPVGDEAKAKPIPPPWLLHMQRYGPPPSYPNLKIPGLNAPIPEGASFGYMPGDWGKPPIDEFGKPLYGDVYGTSNEGLEAQDNDIDVPREIWGQLESEEDESSSEDESGSEDEDEGGDDTGTVTPSGYTSETPSGITSVKMSPSPMTALASSTSLN